MSHYPALWAASRRPITDLLVVATTVITKNVRFSSR